MKTVFLTLSLACLSLLLSSCGSIVESILRGDDDDSFGERRAKQERRAQYRSEGKPSFLKSSS